MVIFGSIARKGLGIEGDAPSPSFSDPEPVAAPAPIASPRGPVAATAFINGRASAGGDVLEVFGQEESAPCRVVYMTCEMVGAKYERKMCDIMKGEHMTPEFLKVRRT